MTNKVASIIKFETDKEGAVWAHTSICDSPADIGVIFDSNPEVDIVITEEDKSFMDVHYIASREQWFSGSYWRNIKPRKTNLCFEGRLCRNEHAVDEEDDEDSEKEDFHGYKTGYIPNNPFINLKECLVNV